MKEITRRKFLSTAGKVAAGGLAVTLFGIPLSASNVYSNPDTERLVKNHLKYYKKKKIILRKSDVGLIKKICNFPEKDLFTQAIYGEARNCTDEEKRWIAYSPINRIKDGKLYNGEGSLKDVLLAPGQYKCFSPTSVKNRKNIHRILSARKHDPKRWAECKKVAKDTLKGRSKHLNYGQDIYVSKKRLKQLEKDKKGIPEWIQRSTPIATPINFKHQFYMEA